MAAGAINAISGTRHTLYRHREIDHFLDVALFDAAVSRQTLDSMMEAIRETVELPRSILRLKAETLGLDGVSWYDLGAPMNLGKTGGVDWSGAKSMVSDSFSAAYPRLGGFFDHVCESEWIDWEIRDGKRPGGFCTGSLLTGESRIFMTYNAGVGRHTYPCPRGRPCLPLSRDERPTFLCSVLSYDACRDRFDFRGDAACRRTAARPINER